MRRRFGEKVILFDVIAIRGKHYIGGIVFHKHKYLI